MTLNGPLPSALGPIARVAEKVYLAELGRRSRRFDAGRGVVTIDRPVISVGNLSVGGTGKTPMVGLVVRWLLDAGHRPAIAMRGYGAKRGLSDEAAEYERLFGDSVPVVAQPDRLEGLFRLFASDAGDAVDVVVLDDGFQHRRIDRQLDLVLIDASRDVFEDRCLPAGWLREPVGALNRASGVVLTHTELVARGSLDLLAAEIETLTGRGPLAEAEHRWCGLDVFDGSVERRESVDWLRGKRVVVVCAIGRPDAFVKSVEHATGCAPVDQVVLRDHDPYGGRTIERVLRSASSCDAVVTTGKDWAKLAGVDGGRWPCPAVRPRLDMKLTRGDGDLRDVVLATTSGRIG